MHWKTVKRIRAITVASLSTPRCSLRISHLNHNGVCAENRAYNWVRPYIVSRGTDLLTGQSCCRCSEGGIGFELAEQLHAKGMSKRVSDVKKRNTDQEEWQAYAYSQLQDH